jgi:hypothetical protein
MKTNRDDLRVFIPRVSQKPSRAVTPPRPKQRLAFSIALRSALFLRASLPGGQPASISASCFDFVPASIDGASSISGSALWAAIGSYPVKSRPSPIIAAALFADAFFLAFRIRRTVSFFSPLPLLGGNFSSRRPFSCFLWIESFRALPLTFPPFLLALPRDFLRDLTASSGAFSE